MCNSKKSKLIKKQKAGRLSNNLGLKTPLSGIPLLSDILLQMDLRQPAI